MVMRLDRARGWQLHVLYVIDTTIYLILENLIGLMHLC